MPPRDARLPLPDASWRTRFRRRLRSWYEGNARDLPWRRSRDPYRVWVSEIMLQQTQVATVKPYFGRFIDAFPTVEALARADESRVLRLWEGLGYYRRARQMHEAARRIVEEHGGRFPRDRDSVRDLPGVGRYTAGAILSIALDAREPILEANTIRLFCRLLAYGGPPRAKEGQTLLWAMAEWVLPPREPGLFNQSLMELGSEVCRNGTPRCSACPVESLCEARRRGVETRIPLPATKPNFEYRREAAVLIRRQGRVLLVRCPDGGRWAGLWDFPRHELMAENELLRRDELVEKVRKQTGLTVELGECLRTIKHGVTRYKITLECHETTRVSGRLKTLAEQAMQWVRPSDLADYPLSSTGRKLSRLTLESTASRAVPRRVEEDCVIGDRRGKSNRMTLNVR
ncbi:MAG TPA: A/G-specific adenine glycosylase [Planctomycetaceae bacterium]|nr:A/G-specific adenine glycosylase [Planctomycetaceae bacterium]